MALSPDRAAIKALQEALDAVLAAAGENPPQAVVRRLREGLAAHAEAVEGARSVTDSVRMPSATFDPSDPKIVGRMVSIALLAQPLVRLTDIRPSYGSGVYAIFTPVIIHFTLASPAQRHRSMSARRIPRTTMPARRVNKEPA